MKLENTYKNYPPPKKRKKILINGQQYPAPNKVKFIMFMLLVF